MTLVSPGTEILEQDLSQYVARISAVRAGAIGFAEWGPVNEVTLITNSSALVNTFGRPLKSVTGGYQVGHDPWSTDRGYLIPYGLLALRTIQELYVVRAAHFETGESEDTFRAAVVLNDSGANATMRVKGKYMGRMANATDPGTGAVSANGISIVIAAATSGTLGAFKLTVYFEGVQVEVWDELTVTTTSDDYFVTRVNHETFGSQWILVEEDALGANAPVAGTFYLTGGQNGDETGDSSENESALIGVTTNTAYPQGTGSQLFRDRDLVAIGAGTLAVPGASRTVQQGVIAAVNEIRKDCLFLIDPPRGVTDTQYKDFLNGTGNYAGNSFNTSRAAALWPWVKFQDNFRAEEYYTPPSGWFANRIGYAGGVFAPWYPPAGEDRGKLSDARGIEFKTDRGQRDALYAPGQCGNVIVNKPGKGICIWGQKTTQRTASKLDRIHVRMLLFYAEDVIARAVEDLVFELNDPVTWRKFTGRVNPLLRSIQAQRGLEKFQVRCDSSTNTPDRRNNNEMYGEILMIPVGAAEKITIAFKVLESGADFSEA